MIWKQRPTVENLNSWGAHTIHEALDIRFTEVGDDYLEGTMPVNEKTQRGDGTLGGILHGGASVVLAESLGSMASAFVNGPENRFCVGIEINASHLNRATQGFVTGRATPLRLGRTLHVWDIKIKDGAEKTAQLVCQVRLTVMVQASPNKPRE